MESMTGYGRAAAEDSGLRVLIEIRGVNHKGLDVHAYLPPQLLRHEMACRNRVRSSVGRGRVEVRAFLELLGERAAEVHLSEGVARALGRAAAQLKGEGVLDSGLAFGDLLSLPDAVQVRLDPASEGEAERILLGALEEALREFKACRQAEGARLRAQFVEALGTLGSHCAAAAGLKDRQVEGSRQRLAQRVQQLGLAAEPGRLEQEIALQAERADVEEEVVRLQSHLQALSGLLEECPSDLGRRLDHLLQEMQRETSTLLAKASLYELTQVGLAIRLIVEQLREQAQNVA
jgi:uncharacterized protein (TIGR00255 family)